MTEAVMTIAIFDSGIGGLSVLAKAMEQMPNQNYLYYADCDHAPYGTKNRAEILALVEHAVTHILSFGSIDALVLACNTATSAAAQELRKIYSIPILGMEPAVKPAVCTYQGKILVTATPFTLKEEKLQHLLERWDAPHRTHLLALPELVPVAEQGKYDDAVAKDYVEQQFKESNWVEYSAIVLGCTHFNFFRPLFRALIPSHVHILEGSIGTVKNLQKQLPQNNNSPQSSVQYLISGKKATLQEISYFQNLIFELQKRMKIE